MLKLMLRVASSGVPRGAGLSRDPNKRLPSQFGPRIGLRKGPKSATKERTLNEVLAIGCHRANQFAHSENLDLNTPCEPIVVHGYYKASGSVFGHPERASPKAGPFWDRFRGRVPRPRSIDRLEKRPLLSSDNHCLGTSEWVGL